MIICPPGPQQESTSTAAMAHVTVLFADTAIPSLHGIYMGMKLERFEGEYRDQVPIVARELEPDTHTPRTSLG